MLKPEAFVVGSIARLIVKKWGSRASGRSKTGRTTAAPARSDQPAGLREGQVGGAPTPAATCDLAEVVAEITEEKPARYAGNGAAQGLGNQGLGSLAMAAGPILRFQEDRAWGAISAKLRALIG